MSKPGYRHLAGVPEDLLNQEKQSPDAFVGLDDEAGVVEVLKTSVFRLWQVVNNLTRLRPSRCERYTVAIFGSARVDPGHTGCTGRFARPAPRSGAWAAIS